MSEERACVGIDFGTTYMRIAIAKKRRNKISWEIIEDSFGHNSIPTIIAFTENGETITGIAAKNQQFLNPERTIYNVGRLLGAKRGDEYVEKIISTLPFKVEFKNDDLIIKIPATQNDEEREYRPEDLIAMMLSEAANLIKEKTKQNQVDCIITVPGYFNDSQRRAMVAAANTAGLSCLKLINASTAAAIAYRNNVKFHNGNVLVFDFGGGTVDVTILKAERDDITVKAVAGNRLLGGEDIDQILCKEVLTHFNRSNPGLDPTESKSAMVILKQKCEEMKCMLSSTNECSISIPSFYGGKDLNEKITRAKLEYLCDELIEQATKNIDEALHCAELSVEDIDYLIMVGGSSKIPGVIERVEDFFDFRLKHLYGNNADEAVAIGAAIICQKLQHNN